MDLYKEREAKNAKTSRKFQIQNFISDLVLDLWIRFQKWKDREEISSFYHQNSAFNFAPFQVIR
jgi:hypothetical protein